MTTKKKRKVKKTVYKKKKKYLPLKTLITVIALLFASLMVLGNTYAWFVSKNDKNNHFEGSRLSVKIVEDFTIETKWASGERVTKRVAVKNIGDIPAFVRISLYEYLLTFQINTNDQTGNGNLMLSENAVTPTVDFSDTNTWVKSVNGQGTYTAVNGEHYIAKKAIVANIPQDRYRTKTDNSNREATELKWLQLGFSSSVSEKVITNTTGYWLYSDGYFYYSKLLLPEEESQPIIENISLDVSAPNKMKGILYKLEPVMDAHDATAVLLDAWNVTTTHPAYIFYKDQLTK